MGQEINEYLLEMNNEFSASCIERLMHSIGMLEKGDKVVIMPFSQYVFLKSKTEEIYGAKERQLIQRIDHIFVITEFRKEMGTGIMPCQVIAADMRDFGEDINSIVLFMKIVIKAYTGWTLFFIRMLDGMHVGMKLFEKSETINCVLCESSKTDMILYDLLWIGEHREFSRFYSMLYEMMRSNDILMDDIDDKALRQRGAQRAYIESLEWLATYLKRDMTYEISRYESFFDEVNDCSFDWKFEDALEELKDIKSSKVNTLEIFFEAEKSEQMSLFHEQDYSIEFEQYKSISESDDHIAELSGKDPEKLIRILKGRHGVF